MLLNASALRYDAIAMELILSEFSSQLGFNGRPIPMQIRFFRQIGQHACLLTSLSLSLCMSSPRTIHQGPPSPFLSLLESSVLVLSPSPHRFLFPALSSTAGAHIRLPRLESRTRHGYYAMSPPNAFCLSRLLVLYPPNL